MKPKKNINRHKDHIYITKTKVKLSQSSKLSLIEFILPVWLRLIRNVKLSLSAQQHDSLLFYWIVINFDSYCKLNPDMGLNSN